LEPDEKNKLYQELGQSKESLSILQKEIKTTVAAEKLRSEPTNEELIHRLQDQEAAFAELKAKVEDSRGLKANEETKKQLKRGIKHMAGEWKKRKKLCISFLNDMEEHSDGAIPAKECLSGNGPIDIDSDEAIIKAAKAFAQRKKHNRFLGKKGKKSSAGDCPPSESFIGVEVDFNGVVTRVDLNDQK